MRETLLLNAGWKFREGQEERTPLFGHFDTYMHAKAQRGLKEATPGFYDQDWQDITIPHDYVLDHEPKEAFNPSQGSYFRGNGWYRRCIRLSQEDRDKRIVLLFDGAGMKTEVYVNGCLAGANQSMYNSFSMDITPYVTFDDELNTLAVSINNDDTEGWWYEGGGLYRNVYLIKTEKVSIDVYGVYVAPELVNKTEKKWKTKIETTVYNLEENTEIELTHTMINAEGKTIATHHSQTTVPALDSTVSAEIETIDPELWSLEKTNMYTVVTDIRDKEGTLLDTYETKFGFRTIRFDGLKGFFLNDKHVKIRAVCLHQDHGSLGVAVPKSVLEYRLAQLYKAGVRGVRCAHNNPDPEMFEITDRLGMLVLDENRRFSYDDETLKQVKSMLLVGRNHPSIIAWSVGNEEPLQSHDIGGKLVKRLKAYVRKFDTSRPVTIALNAHKFDVDAGHESDVLGVNYMLDMYPALKNSADHKAVLATESSASHTTRGVYFTDTNELHDYKGGYTTAYDMKRAPFGSSFLDAIKASEINDHICGTFLWTGIEYRGEAIWPKVISGCGILDNAGIAKDNFYLVKSLWTEEPMVHVLPNFDLAGHEGEEILFITYSNCDEVELIVNGKSLGRQPSPEFTNPQWHVVYEKGSIEARGYRSGNLVAHEKLVTSDTPCALTVTQCTTPTCSGTDTAIYEFGMTDSQGNVCYMASDRLFVSQIKGGRLLGLSNGDNEDHENARNKNRKLFNGAMSAIFAVDEGVAELSYILEDPERGLKKEVKTAVVAAPSPLRVPLCDSILEIKGLREWPLTELKGALDKAYNFSDMNTSQPINIEEFTQPSRTGCSVITGRFVVPDFPSSLHLFVKFEHLSGCGTIKIFHETNCWPNPEPEEFLTLDIPFHQESGDLLIELKGFGCKELLNMVIAIDNTKPFTSGKIVYLFQ